MPTPSGFLKRFDSHTSLLLPSRTYGNEVDREGRGVVICISLAVSAILLCNCTKGSYDEGSLRKPILGSRGSVEDDSP
jgi:hypothetical protein